MFDLLTGLDPLVALGLIVALLFVLTFEFINGFHDTANAVATVIYTNAMTPGRAVVLSGLFNFVGVLIGGVGVAYAIVHLLPVDLLINVTSARGLSMVFSLLAAAIVWNFGTWYLGLPASSSHTLIGSILGVGMANALLHHIPLVQAINWKKATDIGLSLVVSPIVGFVFAGLVLVALLKFLPLSKMHKTPEARKAIDGKKHPPFWTRLALVLSALGVSFVHGSNDGQKGIGLIMLVLIGIAPAKFVLDLDATPYQIDRTRAAVQDINQLYERNQQIVGKMLGLHETVGDVPPSKDKCDPKETSGTIGTVLSTLSNVRDYRDLQPTQRMRVRQALLCIDDTAKNVKKLPGLGERDRGDIDHIRADLTATIEYAPLWVVVAVALALGLGTMVGWKRVVETVGEKIGLQGMTYAQGMSAQVVAMLSIGLANTLSLPVSTGVAGTMIANRSGLQGRTVRNIIVAWVLTLPASILLAAGLYWLASLVTA
jgi:low-affinity inorganic phosphate transporter